MGGAPAWESDAVTGPSDRLLDVVVELVATRGMAGVTIREVAGRAGVSIGAVQHHFPTKDALLLAAMRRVGERFRDQMAAVVAADETPARALRLFAHALACIGQDDRDDAAVWLAVVSHAVVHEPTAAVHREEWSEVESVIAFLIAAHRQVEVHQVSDDAAALLALLDGVAIAVVVEPGRMPLARAVRIVDVAVDRALGQVPA